MWGSLEDRPLVLLCHAAQNADGQLGALFLHLANTAQGAINLVLGVLANGAGVVKDRVGLVDVVGEFVSVVPKLTDYEFAVEQVHLTADGLDVELLLIGGRGLRVLHVRKAHSMFRRKRSSIHLVSLRFSR